MWYNRIVMYRQPNPQNRDRWEIELRNHVEIAPEQILAFFDPSLMHVIAAYQQQVYEDNIDEFIEAPLPELAEHPFKPLFSGIFACIRNNLAVFDDDIEADMDKDPLLTLLLQIKERDSRNDELFLQSMRARRTVVSHFIFETIAARSAVAN